MVKLSTAFAVVVICFTSHASTELVTNGGFETGDFTGWTQSGNTGNTGVDSGSSNIDGSYGAHLGPIGSLGYLTQNLVTTAGGTYDISFALFNDGGSPSEFEFSFDGIQLLDLVNPPAFFVTHYEFQGFSATTASTLLEFGFRQDAAYFHLDDVSVTLSADAVPEPSSFWLVLPAIALLALAHLRTLNSHKS